MPVHVKYRRVEQLKMDCRTIKSDFATIEFTGGDDPNIASLFIHEGGDRSEVTFNKDDARRLAEALRTWADEDDEDR